MSVEQKFVVPILDWKFDQEGGTVEFTREEAEELFFELGDALGYDKPAGYAEDMARLLRHMQVVEEAVLANGHDLARDLENLHAVMDVDTLIAEGDDDAAWGSSGVPDGPTRTIPVEQFERDLAARQVADRLTPRGAPALNPGSGIGSGKLRP